MEKIQTAPIQLTVQSNKETVLVNEEEFTQQLQKFSQREEEQPMKGQLEEKFPHSFSSDSEQVKEETELDDVVFSLVNPFMQINTDSKYEKTVEPIGSEIPIEAETVLSINNLTRIMTEPDFSLSNEELPSAFSLEKTDSLVTDKQGNIEEMKHDVQTLEELVLQNDVLINDTEEVAIQTPHSADKKEVTFSVKDEGEVKQPSNMAALSEENVKQADSNSSQMNPMMTEETNFDLEAVKPLDTKASMTDEEDSIQNTLSLNMSKQSIVEITKPEQPPVSQTIPVTKEEGLEKIKEMVMETVVDDSGVETVRSVIKLTPESLGEVEIELISTDKGLTGKLVFQSEEAKQWMEREWEQFKLPLETKGVSFQAIEFTVNQPIQNHPVQNQLGQFSFSENLSQSNQDQSPNQQANQSDRLIENELKEEVTEQAVSNHTNGLNVYV